MVGLIVLTAIFLLNINNLKAYGIRVVFILSPRQKSISKVRFLDKVNFKRLKEIIKKYDINKIRNIKLCELYFSLSEFKRLLSGIIIFIVYYFLLGGYVSY